MRTAILTYSKAYNYGAVLQAYALQRVIERMGHDCKLIDYHCPGVDGQYSYRFPKSFLDIKINAGLFLSRKKRKEIDKFRQKMDFTDPYSRENISEIAPLFDRFIVGSDQVWNGICTNDDPSFFLDFITETRKKNSYAASFGRTVLSEEQKNTYRRYLADFFQISLREESGSSLVNDLTGRSVPVVLDPVFLLPQKEWESFTVKNEGGYVYIFQYVSNEDSIVLAKKIADRQGKELYISSSCLKARRYGKLVKPKGIEGFLSDIRNAGLVITDSFHCAAFSTIFQRPFFAVLRENDPSNTRLENLLSSLEIHNRIYSAENAERDEPIDYKKVELLLEKRKADSMKFLESIFE